MFWTQEVVVDSYSDRGLSSYDTRDGTTELGHCLDNLYDDRVFASYRASAGTQQGSDTFCVQPALPSNAARITAASRTAKATGEVAHEDAQLRWLIIHYSGGRPTELSQLESDLFREKSWTTATSAFLETFSFEHAAECGRLGNFGETIGDPAIKMRFIMQPGFVGNTWHDDPDRQAIDKASLCLRQRRCRAIVVEPRRASPAYTR
ncbi:mynd finger family protein [Moniliophthora roreri]|nr:mynd finger family protein [Moniliophthora roreri]